MKPSTCTGREGLASQSHSAQCIITTEINIPQRVQGQDRSETLQILTLVMLGCASYTSPLIIPYYGLPPQLEEKEQKRIYCLRNTLSSELPSTRSDWKDPENEKQTKNKRQVRISLQQYRTKNITPYVYAFAYHVPEFIEKYGSDMPAV